MNAAKQLIFPGVEQHDQPEEWVESTDRVPLQVLNKEPDLENYFILAAIGSRRPKNCLRPFSQLEGLVSHHRDILITILTMTIITISCSAMIETLEECVQSIEAAGAKVSFSSFLFLHILRQEVWGCWWDG